MIIIRTQLIKCVAPVSFVASSCSIQVKSQVQTALYNMNNASSQGSSAVSFCMPIENRVWCVAFKVFQFAILQFLSSLYRN